MTDSIGPDWTPCDGNDARGFRSALGAFATGVTVVATRSVKDGSSRAFTANSFSSVSLDPPLVSVCLGKNSASLAEFETAETYSISILEASQKETSNAFAARDPAVKIAATASLAQHDAPYVAGSLASFICQRHAVVDAGDHVILLGRVVKFRVNEGQPLGFFRGAYVGVGPSLLEIEQLHASVRVGAILGQDGQIMLYRPANSDRWELPSARARRGQRADTVLQSVLAPLGVETTMSVPYSLFQEPEADDISMFFTVESKVPIAPGLLPDGGEIGLFSAEDAPWERVVGIVKQGVVKRFLRETASGLFNVYFDSPEGGSLAPFGGRPRAWMEQDVAL